MALLAGAPFGQRRLLGIHDFRDSRLTLFSFAPALGPGSILFWRGTTFKPHLERQRSGGMREDPDSQTTENETSSLDPRFAQAHLKLLDATFATSQDLEHYRLKAILRLGFL